MKNIDEMNLW